MAEEPLDGLAVGAVAELACELENARGAERRHSDAAAAAVNLGVAVLGGARDGGGGPLSDGKCRRSGRGIGGGSCGGFGFGVREIL